MADTKTNPTESASRGKRKVIEGKVHSAKMDKTITVKIERRVPHPRYGKIIRKYTTVYAHDEKNEAKEGDIVEVMETRPLSKLKRYRLLKVVRPATV